MDDKRRDTFVRARQNEVGLEELWSHQPWKGHRSWLSLGHREHKCLVLTTKGESEIRFPRRHEKGKCPPEEGACQKINTLLSFHGCAALRPQVLTWWPRMHYIRLSRMKNAPRCRRCPLRYYSTVCKIKRCDRAMDDKRGVSVPTPTRLRVHPCPCPNPNIIPIPMEQLIVEGHTV